MFELPAALSFYRALRVYPSPVELIMIYQKTVPENVFKIVMEMTSLDVSEPPTTTTPESKPAPPEETTTPSEPSKKDVGSGDEDESSKATRSGPPSETSSQEWDTMTDPGSTAELVPPPSESAEPPL